MPKKRSQIPCNTIPAAADDSIVNRNRHPHTPLLDPPEGLVEMVCTLFDADPVSNDVNHEIPELEHRLPLEQGPEAYAMFGAQVDLFLGARGLRRWADLDVTEFLHHAARTASEAVTLCCMFSTLLPWLARADDLTRTEADALLRRVLEVCPRDADAEMFMRDAIGSLDRHALNVDELRH